MSVEHPTRAPIGALHPSSTGSQAERRRHYDKAAIAELGESIIQHGQLQAIVVRPLPGAARHNQVGLFEIVAGERRWLGAKQAGLSEVDIAVRDLNDQQVLEVQLVENLQREGLHELAEAEGYEALQHKHGYSIDDLVAKVGKSRAYIYARLKLTSLSPGARKAFYEKKISASVALLLARIPVASLQDQALKELLAPPEELSTREASALIHQRYMLSLAIAPFPTGLEDLLKGVPVCGRCPKNTTAQPELFGDVKHGKDGAGTCTDPNCFGLKRDAYAARRIDLARSSGQTVIEGKKAQAITRYGSHSLQDGFARLDDRCYSVPRSPTYRQLLGKDFTPTLLAVPAAARKNMDPEDAAAAPTVIEVVSRAQIDEALKAKGVARGGGSSAGVRHQSAAEKKQKIERKVLDAIYTQLRPKLPAKLAREQLEAIALEFYLSIWNDLRKRVLALWGWESKAEGKKHWDDPDAPVRAHLRGCTDADLALFLQDCLYAREVDTAPRSTTKPEGVLAAAKAAKIDVAAIRRTIEGAVKTRPAKKPRAKK